MSATSRGLIRAFTVSLSSSSPPPHFSNSTAAGIVVSRFLGGGRRLLPLLPCFALSRSIRTAVSARRDSGLAAVMSSNKRKSHKKRKAKKNQNGSSMMEGTSSSTADTIVEPLEELSITRSPVNEPSTMSQFGNVVQDRTSVPGQKTVWKPRSYGTTTIDVQSLPGNQINLGNQIDTAGVKEKKSVDLSAAFRPNLLENFNVDNTTYLHPQIRATFYPKFENEKSDQEVSLKHSGSLSCILGMRVVHMPRTASGTYTLL